MKQIKLVFLRITFMALFVLAAAGCADTDASLTTPTDNLFKCGVWSADPNACGGMLEDAAHASEFYS